MVQDRLSEQEFSRMERPAHFERLEPREFFSASTLTTPGPADRSADAAASSTITAEVKPSEAKESFTRRKPQVPLST
jgi:hypothetical protein